MSNVDRQLSAVLKTMDTPVRTSAEEYSDLVVDVIDLTRHCEFCRYWHS